MSMPCLCVWVIKNLGICAAGGSGGPALGPVLKSLHLGAKGGGPDSGVPPGRHSKGGGGTTELKTPTLEHIMQFASVN